MTSESELAAKRYRQYKWQKHKESLIQRLVAFILRLMKALARALRGARIIRKRSVEKVDVE